MNPKVDAYIRGAGKWREETETLRAILLGCGLTEELKWGKPCYAFQGSNLVIIQGFKGYFALLFFKGALLRDPKGILKKQGEHSQSGRRILFASAQEIAGMKPVLKTYIAEAMAAEKAGLKVAFKRHPEPVPRELRKKMDADPALKAAFKALTPGRQRGYILYISGAKQSKTRESRVEKHRQRILSGKGMDD